MNAEFIMCVGIPGSGKSTYLQKHKEDKLIISPDDIRRELLGDVSDQSNNPLVWKTAIYRIDSFLYTDGKVILDATNCNFSFWQPMICDLPKCKKIAWVFYVNPEVAWKRIEEDIKNNVDRSSNINSEVIYRYYGMFQHTIRMLPYYFDEIVKIGKNC